MTAPSRTVATRSLSDWALAGEQAINADAMKTNVLRMSLHQDVAEQLCDARIFLLCEPEKSLATHLPVVVLFRNGDERISSRIVVTLREYEDRLLAK